MKRIVIMLSILALQVVAADPQIEWFKEIDCEGQEKIHGLDIGFEGDLFFTGESDNGEFNLELWKYSSDGDSLWRNTYSENDGDIGYDLVVLPDNDIAVVGIEYLGDDPRSVSLRFDSDGELIKALLTPAYTRDAPPVIAARHEDSCYVGTWGEGGVSDFQIKYYLLDSNWDIADGYTTDASMFMMTGMVIGSSGSFYQVRPPCGWGKMSYDLKGLGVKDYEGNPGEVFNAQGLAISEMNELYCCGDVFDNPERDFFLLKWDTQGNPIWGQDNHKRYDMGAEEYCLDVTLDEITDCYLAGYQAVGEEEDVVLVKTDSAGNMLWSWVYEMEGDQEIEGIEVDEDGYIYLAGSHHNGENWDMLLMQVRQPLMITGRVTDSTGAAMEDITVVLSGDTTVEVITDTGGYYGIEVYNGGDYTVSPDLPGWAFLPSSYTYSPLAHREFNQDFSGEWTAVEEEDVTSLVRLEVNSSEINYSLPPDQKGILKVFDALDQLVERVEVNASGSVEFNSALASGVYLVRLESKQATVTKKAVVLR